LNQTNKQTLLQYCTTTFKCRYIHTHLDLQILMGRLIQSLSTISKFGNFCYYCPVRKYTHGGALLFNYLGNLEVHTKHTQHRVCAPFSSAVSLWNIFPLVHILSFTQNAHKNAAGCLCEAVIKIVQSK